MLSHRGVFLDANLLVLIVVGATGRDLISKHRRLRGFSADNYDDLVEWIDSKRVLVTPNTLTEASNLLGYHGEPERSRFFHTFRRLIENSVEIVVASVDASNNTKFDQS